MRTGLIALLGAFSAIYHCLSLCGLIFIFALLYQNPRPILSKNCLSALVGLSGARSCLQSVMAADEAANPNINALKRAK